MRGIHRNICAAKARIILNSEKVRGRDSRNKLLLLGDWEKYNVMDLEFGPKIHIF